VTVRDKDAIRARCTHFLSMERPVSASQLLRGLADHLAEDVMPDSSGTGALVEELQNRVAALLGKPKALFFSSGRIAQQIVLRVFAERRDCRRVAIHPRSHMEEYEAKAYSELHALSSAAFGDFDRLPTAADLETFSEKIAVATIELPLRRLGCLLPTWAELIDISRCASARSIPLHLDGARLWESQPFYGRDYAEISSLFDTVYVSFYKGLNGLAGAILAGPEDIIAQATVWQRRSGGRLNQAFPYLVAAIKGLDERLPRMAVFWSRAVSVARCLEGLEGLRATPDRPQTNAMLVLVDGQRDHALDAVLDTAETTGVWVSDRFFDSPIQNTFFLEITVREPAMQLTDEDVRRAMETFRDKIARRARTV
jgi:threonine aldolase